MIIPFFDFKIFKQFFWPSVVVTAKVVAIAWVLMFLATLPSCLENFNEPGGAHGLIQGIVTILAIPYIFVSAAFFSFIFSWLHTHQKALMQIESWFGQLILASGFIFLLAFLFILLTGDEDLLAMTPFFVLHFLFVYRKVRLVNIEVPSSSK